MKSIKKYKSLWCLLAITTFLCFLIFLPYLIKGEAFYLGWDMRTQYSSFFEELRTMLTMAVQERKIPFYSWNYFLGNNFYSNKLFYYHDFIDWFFALFTDLSYNSVIMIETYIKFIISSVCFYAYAKYNGYKERTCIIGSLMFAFSAYGLQIMMHPFFATFFVFLPLYFLAVDIYLKKKKRSFYVLISFLLVVINYYLFYSLSLFTILYYIYRYYQLHGSYSKAISSAIPLILSYFIAILMSAFVLVPEAMSIMQNNRVGNSGSLLWYESIIPYSELITGLFTPTSAIANRSDVIGNLYAYTSSNESLMPLFVWISSIGTLLVPQAIIKEKNNRITIIIIIIFALIPFMSSIMHGFSEPSFRWMCFTTFLLVVMCLKYIDEPNIIDNKLLYYTQIIVIVLVLICTPLMCLINNVELKEIINGYLIIIITTIPFIIINGMIINRNILILGLVMELVLVSYFSYAKNPMFSGFKKQSIYQASHVLGGKNDLNNYLNELDNSNVNSFYRIYVDPSSIYWDYSTNYNLNYNFMGVMSYDTTYAYQIDKMREIADISTYLDWAFDIRDNDLLNQLCVKYALVTNEDQLPNGNYQLAGEFNYILIYQNMDYINLGTTYSDVSTYDDYDFHSVIVENDMYNVISNYTNDGGSKFNIVNRKLNYLYTDIETKEEGFCVISIPYDKGWNITVNGNVVETYSVNGGMMGIRLDKGYSEVVMTFMPSGFKTGCLLSSIGIMMFLILFVKERKYL